MPQIIVRAYTRDGKVGAVTLAERAVPTEQHNAHYIEHLIERVGWALIDAERLAAGQLPSVRPAAGQDSNGERLGCP